MCNNSRKSERADSHIGPSACSDLIHSSLSRSLPAEMLVEPSGRVKAVKYGRHAYDQWSVDELLSLAGSSDPGTEPRENHLPRILDQTND